MRYLLFILAFCLNYGLMAQQLSFEKNCLGLQKEQLWRENLHYDPFTDLVTVGSDAGDSIFTAEDIQYFTWNGDYYFSLPLNGGHTFFRVLHEGSRFAVLHKEAGNKLYQYFVQESGGAVQICEDEGRRIILCEQQIGPSFGMPAFGEASVTYRVQDAVFLAVDGALHLVNFTFDTKGELFATIPSLRKNNRRTLKRLRKVINNEQQMQQLKQYVATHKTNLQDPQQLILALSIIYP